VQDASRTIILTALRRQPVSSVVVGAQQTAVCDVLEGRQLGKRAGEFVAAEVERVVVDGLAGVFKGLKEEADLAEVARSYLAYERSLPGQMQTNPLPSSTTMAPEGIWLAISAAWRVRTLISLLVR
jgi:hypothetical protein